MRITGRLALGLSVILALALTPVVAVSAQKVSPGSPCKVLKQKISYLNKTYTCLKSGKKMIWTKGVVEATPAPAPTDTQTPEPVQPSPQSSPTTQTTTGYPRPVITPDNDCPRLVSLKLDKTNLNPSETTKLRIEYKDNLNSIQPVSLGLGDDIWWGPSGLLSRADYKLSNFTVTSSQIVDGFVRESISIDFQAPSVAGKWIFQRFWLRDRSGIKWPYNRDGHNDCKTREYVSASYPDADFEVIQTTPSPKSSATPSATPTVSATPTPSPTASQSPISPGAFCAPAGATGVNSSGVKYTCKTSETDTRNRWRQ